MADIATLVYTQYFDGRDAIGLPMSEARNSDRNYLVQRNFTWTCYGYVRRNADTKRWYGVVGDRVMTPYYSTRKAAASNLVALNPYGVTPYAH